MIKSLLLFLFLTTNTLSPVADVNDTPKQPVYYKDKVIVLMYHEIKNTDGKIALSTDLFDKHLKMLKNKDYNVISIEQFLDFKTGTKKDIPSNAVVLTFDDGYEDFYENAYPILQKYKMTATNFIIVKSTDIFNPDIIPHLKWDQMREMREKGMSFYSHTYDSHKYTATNNKDTSAPLLAGPIYLEAEKRMETTEEYYTRVKTDLSKADELLIAQLGNKHKILSFPYGRYSDATLEIGKELGIDLYITIKEGINSADGLIATRLNAGAHGLTAKELLTIMQAYNDKVE